MSTLVKTAHLNAAVSFYGLNIDHFIVNWDTRYQNPALSGYTKLRISLSSMEELLQR